MIEKDDQTNMNGEEPRKQNHFDADNEYGLPEVEFSPIEREPSHQPEETIAFNKANSIADHHESADEKKSSSLPLILILAGIILLAGIFVYFFAFDNDSPQEQLTQRPEAAAPFTYEEEEEEDAYVEDDWNTAEAETEAPVAEGSVSNISQRTGRYYVIVGSFIDGDLAADFANRLAKEGQQAKIIEPSGTQKFYRLSVNDAESISDLQANMDNMKAKYGENIWIVKY